MTDRPLNDIMQFDHVIIVSEDGTIADAPNERRYYAPTLLDDELDDSSWEFFSVGYTGQDRYNGPIMHNSEYIGGRLESDIRSTPGVYVAVISNYSTDPDGENIDYTEGWAIARLKGAA